MACNRIHFPISPCGVCKDCVDESNQWKAQFQKNEGCKVLALHPGAGVNINIDALNNKRPAEEHDLRDSSKRTC